ncbi:MAG: hypothetical protein M1834_000059 [Cirrosporium novae-zelandiae]|nr:MAG: hypothetical protein M1834_000059 [Cirrosporium novae-zelandiae]
MATGTPAIHAFLKDYLRRYDTYERVARLASEKCEEELNYNGIRAMITFRAKPPEGLAEKLEQRQAKRREDYKDVDAVRADIPDLAGVRISLYFPNDRAAVERIIQRAFHVQQAVCFPKDRGSDQNGGGGSYIDDASNGTTTEGENERQTRRLGGYYADHYQVHLRPGTLIPRQSHYSNMQVEIQVASILMHSWSQVERDLVYKAPTGSPSQDELKILAGINGLVHIGEALLQKLQAAVEFRVSSSSQPFANQFELRSFLHTYLSQFPEIKRPVMGRVDVLLAVLQETHLNTAQSLTPKLKALDFPNRQLKGGLLYQRSNRPTTTTLPDISICIIDSILQTTPLNTPPTPSHPFTSQESTIYAESPLLYKSIIMLNSAIWLSELFRPFPTSSPYPYQSQYQFQSRPSHYPTSPTSPHPTPQKSSSLNLGPRTPTLTSELTVLYDLTLSGETWTQRVSFGRVCAVNSLWTWFATHEGREVRVAFGLSRLGLLREFWEDRRGWLGEARGAIDELARAVGGRVSGGERRERVGVENGERTERPERPERRRGVSWEY